MNELETKIAVLTKKLKTVYEWLFSLTIIVVILIIFHFITIYKMKTNCDKVNEVNQKFNTELGRKCDYPILHKMFTDFSNTNNHRLIVVEIPNKNGVKTESKGSSTNNEVKKDDKSTDNPDSKK
ncbi:hypothetical protein ATP_00405 [Candidatus Phytoplasma mali]|uniref:Uncharacterized protein n=1 Tax=Phytoplasma mali (strain AT) TaxID=482235 RepID=B3QZI5_PHYMT|nr:hypothetical protein [Candidatus Phytoplasma mali]CAP18592.1 hypothetical protein ATP_00405 [Candidatus Phytoplasma mali]